MSAVAIIFWTAVGLLAYTQAGYPVLLWLVARLVRRKAVRPLAEDQLPTVSVIVAAYAEQDMIGPRVANLRSLDYPPERLEVIVSCDGSPDHTPRRAREAGADLVLELSRGGKVAAQDAGVERAHGDFVAFSDANVTWEPDALRHLLAPFSDPRVGYVCGEVRLLSQPDDARKQPDDARKQPDDARAAQSSEAGRRAGRKCAGTNQEGLYWRYEMALRGLESRVRSVTGGNGAIYATRRESYLVVDPIMGHDLAFPFNMVKQGWRAVYAPEARASEKMVPTVEGEFARKRRMMGHTWPIVIRGGMLSPRGYDPLYAFMIVSHRVLRYLSPFLHLVALGTSIALLGHGWVYAVAVGLQAALVAGALLAAVVPARPLLIARYYVFTTASLLAGLWDWLSRRTTPGWEPAEGTR
ncbi:MAG TPA: glycosyltransferase [Solirubrobacteraceae bacterium]|nr:glycosyltransferase [Solirubrobacteraceae bacterium]